MAKLELETTLSRLYVAIKADNKPRYSQRIGASWIGTECDRAIWYRFRWAKLIEFDGRMLRLFRTGQLAEKLLADDLRKTGATVLDVDPETSKQFFFDDLDGHFCGFMDGAGVGFVEAPETWHVIEYKTHNDKSFKDLQKNGVEKSKPEHFAQMQVYMGWSGMERALYVALNKNTDEIHIERIKFSKKEFTALRQRAKEIIHAIEPPERLNESPAFYKCKMCDYSDICHGMGAMADKNCRTCKFSEVDGKHWQCTLHGNTLTLDAQKAACEDYSPACGMAPDEVCQAINAFCGTITEDELPF